MGTNDITERVKNGDMLVLDAINNQVIINPTADQLNEARSSRPSSRPRRTSWPSSKTRHHHSDGHRVEVRQHRDRQ